MALVNGVYTFDFAGGDGNGESYAPPELVGYAKEKLKVALPDPSKFPKPPTGYPWVLRLDFSGFTLSNMLATIGTGLPFEFGLLNDYGTAVVYTTCVRTIASGATEVPGNALFWPEDYVPAGWTGPLPPGRTLSRPMPERDVEFAVQYVRANARRFGLNPYQAGFRGDSAGSQAGARAVFGRDRKYAHGHKGQHVFSTRFQAAFCAHVQLYWPVFLSTVVAKHWASVGGAPSFETPCTNLGDAFTEAKDGASAALFWDQAANALMPVLLWHDTIPVTADFTIPHAATESTPHTAFHGYMAHPKFPKWTLAVTAAVNAAVTTAPLAPDVIVEASAIEAYAAGWMAANLKPAYPFEVFDLLSEEPSGRITTRRAIREPSDFGPRFVRQADHRPIRTYDVTIRHAQPLERQRLQALWSKTRFGTSPMLLPHKDDGFVPVVFDEPELRYRQLNARATDVRVRLREVIGV